MSSIDLLHIRLVQPHYRGLTYLRSLLDFSHTQQGISNLVGGDLVQCRCCMNLGTILGYSFPVIVFSQFFVQPQGISSFVCKIESQHLKRTFMQDSGYVSLQNSLLSTINDPCLPNSARRGSLMVEKREFTLGSPCQESTFRSKYRAMVGFIFLIHFLGYSITLPIISNVLK